MNHRIIMRHEKLCIKTKYVHKRKFGRSHSRNLDVRIYLFYFLFKTKHLVWMALHICNDVPPLNMCCGIILYMHTAIILHLFDQQRTDNLSEVVQMCVLNSCLGTDRFVVIHTL